MKRAEREIVELVEWQTNVASANVAPSLMFADGTFIIDALKAWNAQMQRLLTGAIKPGQTPKKETD